MIARVRTRRRTCRAWIAQAMMAVTVIGGPFATHGLPTIGPDGMSHAGPPSSQKMASEDMGHVVPIDPQPGAAVPAPRATEVPSGCGMDHANCVAVLRAEQHPAPVAALGI